jgi:hypothetical protein
LGLTFSLFIVLLALIAFLVLYYLSVYREDLMEKRKPDLADVELAEELGIKQTIPPEEERKFMEKATKIEVDEDAQPVKKPLQNTTNKKKATDSPGEYSWLGKKLKFKYNKTFIRLFSRDPNLLYTYWEVNDGDYYNNSPLLRLSSQENNNFRDIKLNSEQSNYYISGINPDHTYKAAIGYEKNGLFKALAYSDWVTTPPDSPSDIIDEKWMSIDELYEEETYQIKINSSLSILQGEKRRRKKKEEDADSYSFSYKD